MPLLSVLLCCLPLSALLQLERTCKKLAGSLESIDGVHLSHDDSAAETSERLSTALTNISISSNKCNLDKFIVH